ncbi:MAG: type II secretion system protein M [Hyphomonas sp.]|mgnify:FL=1|uniref:type II secretion system protein GspM n=1 Tax=Hyphomonas sp. TaxID=87 RepID=UPI001B08ED27|nr:type II secretion system protein GspM [Hyphomonas sp.]MBO6582211.1 type II secretion system protein M [Hyphomonas sp.]
MMGYWNSRTGRERALIGVALLLLIVALLQFAIVRPLMAAKADSKLALEAASRQLDVVSAELTSQTTRVAGATAARASSQNLRSDLLQLANARGLSVSRLQTADDGRLILQFERTVPTLVYAWLADADMRYGAVPERVTMFAEEAGYVRASFEFAGGGS